MVKPLWAPSVSTMIQSDLFNEGERLKSEGKDLAVKNRADVFRTAKQWSKWLGNLQETVTADDVHDRMEKLGYVSGDLGNAAGSVFSGGQWERVGYTKSRRPSNHARVIGVWRLRNRW